MAKKKAPATSKPAKLSALSLTDPPPPPPPPADIIITKLSDGAGNFVPYTPGITHARPCFVHGVHNSTAGGLVLSCNLFAPGVMVPIPAAQITLAGFDFTVEIKVADIGACLCTIQLELRSGVFLVASTTGTLNLT